VGFEYVIKRAFDPKMSESLFGMTFDLGFVNGYSIEVPAIYDISKHFSIEFAYKYDYWHIRKSNIVCPDSNLTNLCFYEPESKTRNQLLKFGLVYRF
jgi:long-subunit fatty acid transport protein